MCISDTRDNRLLNKVESQGNKDNPTKIISCVDDPESNKIDQLHKEIEGLKIQIERLKERLIKLGNPRYNYTVTITKGE